MCRYVFIPPFDKYRIRPFDSNPLAQYNYSNADDDQSHTDHEESYYFHISKILIFI
jgi:hypothetical protein